MLEVIPDFIPVGRRNRPGIKMTPAHITIHDTANANKGADALAHTRYLKGDSAAKAPVSWHFSVDDQRAIQHLPLDEVGWHAGDGRKGGGGNMSSIGVEICENADGDRARAEANAAALAADLLRQLGLGIEAVVQHNHWTGKNCPRVLRARPGGWEHFLAVVGERLQSAAPAPQPPGEARPTPQAPAPAPGAKLNVALCRPEDLDVAIPPAPARLTEIVGDYGLGLIRVVRASNANLFVIAGSRPLGLLYRGGKAHAQYPWNWPVFLVRGDRAEILPDGYKDGDLSIIEGARIAFGAGPLLVREGRACDVAAEMAGRFDAGIRPYDRSARVAVGIRPDGRVLHAVADAATLQDFAQVLAASGCQVAMALDGGGSVGLVEGGKLVAGQDARKLPCALVIRQTVQTPAPEPMPPSRNPAAEIRRLIDRGALPAGTYDPRFPFTAGELAPLLNDVLDRLEGRK